MVGARRSGMRRLPLTRAAAVGALALVGFTAASATPCAACSCAALPSLAEAAARADVVFVGTLVETRSPGPPTSSGDAVARAFTVTEVRKGSASAVTEVRTAASGASCGLEVEQGRTYVVVATSTSDGLRSSLCDGTTLASDVTVSDLAAVGPATPPAAGASRVELPGLAAGFTDVVRTPLLWGPVAAASALVTVGLALLRRRRVARRHPA
ncbi:hypothetical protein [Oryzobacter telluris]|uniref:hypothetical protein n=1 Tax=Oryzobacter telluris TaxID=3149179 RepID=UPI00370DB135